MTTNINLPDDLNKAVLYVNIGILFAVLAYSQISGSESILPNAFVYIYFIIAGIIISFFVWWQKNRIISDFNQRFGNRLRAEWYFYHSSYDYPHQLRIADLVSVAAFGLYHLIGLIAQMF